MGGLDVQAATRADARFEAMVEGNPSPSFCRMPTISGLPSGISAGSQPDYGPEMLSTLPSPTIIPFSVIHSPDKTFLEAGKILQLPVSMGVRTK